MAHGRSNGNGALAARVCSPSVLRVDDIEDGTRDETVLRTRENLGHRVTRFACTAFQSISDPENVPRCRIGDFRPKAVDH